MAKFKKTAGKTSARSSTSSKRGSAKPGPKAQAEQLSKTMSESAQQIWLAGVGAFGRAQAEGTKLFEALVKEGLSVEQTARKFAGGRAEDARAAVETTMGQARERAADTWDRLEKVFENRVQQALVKLGVPGRADLTELNRRVATLTTELRRQNDASPKKRASSSASKAAKKTSGAARKTTKKAAKKATRKTAKKATKKTVKKAAKKTSKKTAKKATKKTARKPRAAKTAK